MMQYKIEVMMTPDHSHGPFCPPYFWCILGYENGTWCNCGHGWASTPEDAWNKAYEYCDNIPPTKFKPKKKTGCETPEYSNQVSMPPIKPVREEGELIMKTQQHNNVEPKAYIDLSKAIIIKTRFKEIQQEFKKASLFELVPCSVSNAINYLCEALDDLIKINNIKEN